MIKYIKNEIKLIKEKDPSINNILEIFIHPSFKIKIYYNIAHYFYKKKHFFIARFFSERGKKVTGIEIHPGATIGKNLFIDHGNGIVIGETTVIGNNVTIYHGVTLGATNNNKVKRHPTIKDNVLLGCNSIILGDVTINENSKIGANAVVLEDVSPNTTVVGVPAKEVINKKIFDFLK